MGKGDASVAGSIPSDLERREALVARLLGQEAEEILPRISEGDPLGVHVVCMRRLREQALVIDPDRAFQRALLEIAVDLSMAGEGDLSPLWMQNSVDRSLARLRRNDQEAERAQAPLLDEGLYAYVHEAFGIPPGGQSARVGGFQRHAGPGSPGVLPAPDRWNAGG